MDKLLGLNSAYCRKCKAPRIVSESKPYFCLTCGSYDIEEKVQKQ